MKYKVLHFPILNSTNSYLKDNYKSLEDFTFVSCDYQSSGKGRNDRVWTANSGENLLFSLLIKNKEIIENYRYFPLISAFSVGEIIEKYTGKKVEIKWPNDIYINDKKVAGILLEGSIPDYVVIGIGINVNQKKFLGEYRKEPTSLFLEINKEIDINNFKQDLYLKLFECLLSLNIYKDIAFKYFHEHDYLLSKEVGFVFNNVSYRGTVLGIDDDFNILIENDSGVHHISSGEIELLK